MNLYSTCWNFDFANYENIILAIMVASCISMMDIMNSKKLRSTSCPFSAAKDGIVLPKDTHDHIMGKENLDLARIEKGAASVVINMLNAFSTSISTS